MEFLGDVDDRCVISFLPVADLQRPVGFDGRHAFECECIVDWLCNYRATHPVTGQAIPKQPLSSVLHPLVVNGNDAHVSETQCVLLRSGWTIDSEARPAVVSNHFGCNHHMSFPIDDDEQERLAVSWRVRLSWNVVFGLVQSFVDFIGRLCFPGDMVFSVVENVVSVASIVAMIYKHYPVNRHLVLFYLSALSVFIQFIIKDTDATAVERLDKIALVFYGAKFLLDFAVWATGSRLV
jgi:hypothetical protein